MVAKNEHLVYYFSKDGQPNKAYLKSVKARSEQQIIDLCQRPYDQQWLNYSMKLD